jgi:hypothetical protein
MYTYMYVPPFEPQDPFGTGDLAKWTPPTENLMPEPDSAISCRSTPAKLMAKKEQE